MNYPTTSVTTWMTIEDGKLVEHVDGRVVTNFEELVEHINDTLGFAGDQAVKLAEMAIEQNVVSLYNDTNKVTIEIEHTL